MSGAGCTAASVTEQCGAQRRSSKRRRLKDPGQGRHWGHWEHWASGPCHKGRLGTMHVVAVEEGRRAMEQVWSRCPGLVSGWAREKSEQICVKRGYRGGDGQACGPPRCHAGDGLGGGSGKQASRQAGRKWQQWVGTGRNENRAEQSFVARVLGCWDAGMLLRCWRAGVHCGSSPRRAVSAVVS
jgi:hypothetical protein